MGVREGDQGSRTCLAFGPPLQEECVYGEEGAVPGTPVCLVGDLHC